MDNIYTLTSPTSLLLYAIPLALILATTLVRAAVMSWRLLGVGRPRIRVERLLEGAVSADDLARAALAKSVSPYSPSEDRLAQLRGGPRLELDGALRTLRTADVRFEYLWRRMKIRVSSTWNLMRLTLLAAGLTTTSLFFPQVETLSYGHRSHVDTIVGVDKALFGAGKWAFTQLAIGFAVAGVLCVVAMVFDGLLQRRLATWKYFYASACDALSDAQSGSSSER